MRGTMWAAAVCGAMFANDARAEFIDLYARQDDVGESKVPRFGSSRLLVIPVEVKGAGYADLPHDRLVQFFETRSDAEFRFRSYFESESNGRFLPEVKVAPNVVFDGCPEELDNRCSISRGDINVLKSAVALMRTVFRRAHDGCFAGATHCDGSAAVDFSLYDQNGIFQRKDGFVDGVMLVTNIPNVFISLPLSALNDAGPDDLAQGHGGPFVLDDTKIPLVAVCGDPRLAGTHPENACVHEFGHLLGLADLYQEPSWLKSHPELEYGGLEASAMGVWSFDTSAPYADAESRYRLQWADVDVVSGTRTITLAPAASGGRVVKLGMMGEGRREYWLAEARGPVGPYDRDIVRSSDKIPVYGLSVYHVDWSRGPSGTFIKQILSCLDCDPWHPFMMNVQADRRFELQQNKPFRPEEDLFGAGSSFAPAQENGPFSKDNAVWGANYYDGTSAGIKIDNIRVDPDTGFVTADFTAPAVVDVCADLRCGPGQQCLAGNCRPPEEQAEPKPAPHPTSHLPAKVQDGWGCHAAPPPAPTITLIALIALLGRRRRKPFVV